MRLTGMSIFQTGFKQVSKKLLNKYCSRWIDKSNDGDGLDVPIQVEQKRAKYFLKLA